MNAREITIRNIGNCSFHVGKSIQGKGTEVFRPSRYLGYFGYFEDKEEHELEAMAGRIAKFPEEDTYVESIVLSNGQRFEYNGNWEASVSRFKIENLRRPWERGIQSVSYNLKPVFIGHVNIAGYKSDYESQIELIGNIHSLNGSMIVEDSFSDNSYDELANSIEFTAYDDYTLVHGDGVIPDTDSCEYVDGRVNNYNDSVIDDFWNFDMAEDSWLDEIDPDGKVCVYHRKGKDWYVGSTYYQETMCIDFKDSEREDVDEELSFFIENHDQKLVNKALSYVESLKKDCEVKSLISNQLNIGAIYGDHYPDDTFNLNILRKEYEDEIYDVKYSICDFVDYKLEPEEGVQRAYEEFLMYHIDDEMRLFGKYTHLQQLQKIVEREGKELVRTKIGEFTDSMAFAIRYKDEEYHFTLHELYDDGAKELYERASSGLSTRLNALYSNTILLKKASTVFVGLEDSYSSGNCVAGTKSFCSRHGVDINKIGGIRGDALLEMDFSMFTRNAVAAAIKLKGSVCTM